MKKFSLLLAVWMVLLFGLPALAGTSVNGSDVTFTFKAPDATAVYLSGSFNSWNPAGQKMSKGADGVWSVTIPLKPGTYQYKFVVDGTWTPDPDATSTVDDGYGGKNAVLLVREKSAAAAGADDARLSKVEADIAAIKAADQGFSFHGYARSGFSMNDKGGSTHQNIKGSGEMPGRLGNETDTYLENTLSKKFTMADGSWMNAVFTWAHKNYEGQSWENTSGGDNYAQREAYVEAGNLAFAPQLKFWAGQRFYGRNDIHLNDFYWRDMSGHGAGVQGIHLGGFTKLDIAFIGSSSNSSVSDIGDDNQRNLDFRFTDIAAGPGKLEFEYCYSNRPKALPGDNDLDGFQTAVVYGLGSFFGVTEGSSTIALQYGKGAGQTFSMQEWHTDAKYINSQDRSNTRLVAYGVSQITPSFEVMPSLIYQISDYDTAKDDPKWLNFVVRPVYHFSKNFALQTEFGIDQIKDHDPAENWKGDGIVRKLTIAPTLTLDTGFWARPQLRAYVTHATWSGNINPTGMTAYAGKDSITTYGVQMEVWW